MFSTITILENLHRPKILVRAARIGLMDYNRERELRRLTRSIKIVSIEETLDRLLSQETDLEEARRNGDACYSIQQHIRVLTAVLAEARLICSDIRVAS